MSGSGLTIVGNIPARFETAFHFLGMLGEHPLPDRKVRRASRD
jgi:hypothetical protein